jgi:hypothetical protein
VKFPEFGGGRSQSAGKSGGLFISLKDGDKVQGVFRGEPFVFGTHWKAGKSQVCTGKPECPGCAAGESPKMRFKLNMVLKQDGVWTAKIYEGGYSVYKQLKELHEGDYDLETTAVSISRKGTEMDTEYSVLPLPPSKNVTPADLASIAHVPLNKLKDETEDDLPF